MNKACNWSIFPGLLAAIMMSLLVGCPPSSSKTIVPDVVGMVRLNAEWAIVTAQLVVGEIIEEYSDSVAEGSVVIQTPAAYTEVNPGSSVDLVISLGPEVSEGEGEGEIGKKTILLPGNLPLEMVWIPNGSYLMGRYSHEAGSSKYEDPCHTVTFSTGFWLGKYEVTKVQWTAVMNTMPWSGEDYVLNDLESPAVFVSWNDAMAFITALNTYIEDSNQGPIMVRLPSEAEWEYACRADTTTRFYWGDDLSETVINENGWWNGNSWDTHERYAHVVGQKLPNAWGLYDMSGNVYEWCEDDWHENYTGAPANGIAWIDSPRILSRVVRGGRWNNDAFSCRSAYRSFYYATRTDDFIGFRLLATETVE